MSSFLDRTIMSGLLLAIVFTALAHGAVEAWSVALYEVMIIALVFLWAVKCVVDRELRVVVPKTALPVAALLVYSLAQSLAVSDATGRVRSLSMDFAATRESASVLFFLLLSFIISANFFVSRKRLRALAYFLVIYGVVMAMFALVQHFTWNGKFYWLIPNTQSASPFGPFVSHNHFSGYMEMLFALPAALAMMRAESREARLFFGFAAIVMVIAAIASLSRGGMISLAATVIFLIVWRWKINSEIRRSRSVYVDGRSSRIVSFIRSGAVAVAVIAVISVGLMWVGPDRIAERVTSGSLTGDAGETFYASRGWIWRDTISMIRDNPVLGVGFGAYETVYPIYSQTSGTLIVGQAHNDYLQILADCGLIGGLLAGWFIWQVSGSISRGVRSRDRLLAGLAMGASAGVFAIMVHSFLDFNLQLISNALLFMMLLSVVFQVERLTTAGRKTGIEAPARGASSRAGALLSR